MTNTRPITVSGIAIAGSTLDRVWEAMGAQFTIGELEQVLRNHLSSSERKAAYRAADRIVQNKRRAGEAAYNRPNWVKLDKAALAAEDAA